MADNNKDSRLLAALCYVPFMLVNVIAILYVLLAKKGGAYAKYHALQGLSVAMIVFAIGIIITFAFTVPMMQRMVEAQNKFIEKNSANASAGELRASALEDISGTFSGTLPFMATSLAIFLVQLALAMGVGLGKDVRVPLLREFLARFV